jgi:Fe2+ transport system protein B
MREDRDAIEAAEQARQELLGAAGAQTGADAAQARVDDEAAQQQALQDEIAVINTRTEAGRRAAAIQDEIRQRSLQEDIEYAAAQEAVELQAQTNRNAIFRAEQDEKAELLRREQEQRLAFQEQYNEIQEQDRANRQRIHEEQIRQLEQQRQAHQRLSQEIQGYAQPLVSGFVGAMSKVIAGTESAGDAFKGLLSSFLEFISQQAALKAAFEFAEALVALASFNYPGAAMHAAAGAAFTAVAIASGAGAIATAPSAGAPASPAANQAPQGGGPTVNNIYWNSPVVTTQDHAELGRSINQLTSRSASRFASSV